MLNEHIEQTEQQIDRLKDSYEVLGHRPKRQNGDTAQGLVTESQKVMQRSAGGPDLLDVAVLGAISKVNEEEVASFVA